MENKELKNYITSIQPKYKFKKVILFGSRARRNNKVDSDIDLLVQFDNKNKSLFTIAKLINEIENQFNLDVDIIPYPIPNTIAGIELKIDKQEVLYD